MTDSAPRCPNLTAVILAGGQSRRMSGADKALLPLAGRPMLAHVIAALQPQVDAILISSNRPAADYAAFGLPVIADMLPDQPGPLAGVLSALKYSGSDFILAVPCDTPCLPPDLAARMCAALLEQQADACTVSVGDRLQAAIMLVHRRALTSLQRYLADGQRRVQEWLRSVPLAVVDYGEQPEAFSNVNTPLELDTLEQRLTRHEH